MNNKYIYHGYHCLCADCHKLSPREGRGVDFSNGYNHHLYNKRLECDIDCFCYQCREMLEGDDIFNVFPAARELLLSIAEEDEELALEIAKELDLKLNNIDHDATDD